MDFILKLLAVSSFLAFLGVLAVYVPEWNLLAVLAIAAAMAIYDFFFRRVGANDRN